jgi:uncharacterized protein (DUF2267 family)
VQRDEFIGEVQARAGLTSPVEAERATRATLETLAEHLASSAATRLAAQLPYEIGEHLRRVVAAAADDPDGDAGLGADTFFARVAERAGVDRPAATFHARAVLETTDEATTGALLDYLRAQLPRRQERVLDTAGTAAPTRI